MTDDAQLIELKKQTRILAQKEARKTAMSLASLSVIVLGIFIYARPDALNWLPLWTAFAVPIAFGILGYIASYADMTK